MRETDGIGPGSMHSGLPGQVIRFGIAGGIVALLYVAVTTILAEVVGIPFQIALGAGFAMAVSVHFVLQRVFVWTSVEGFALPARHQVGRYLAVAVVQYGVTAVATAVLPNVLHIRVTFVYLATVAVMISFNFLVFRAAVFHPKSPSATAPARRS